MRHAYALARANAGAPGVDGVTFAQIEAAGVEAWLAGLREELVSKTYRPDPVRRVMIPKPGGGERAARHPDHPGSGGADRRQARAGTDLRGGLRGQCLWLPPRRGAVDAVKEVHRLICRGYTDVVDADLSKYFDTIPHADLLKSVARRIVDRHVLRLIKLWLKAPVEERDGDGKRRMRGGKSSTRGTPQGGVASPLLCQHLHEPVPEALAADRTRRSVPCACRLVCRRLRHPQPRSCGRGAGVDEGGDDEARADAQRGEDLVEGCPDRNASTSLATRSDRTAIQTNGRWYLGASPSKKSVQRLKTKVGGAAGARQQGSLAGSARHA